MGLPHFGEVVGPLDLQAQVVDRHDATADGFRRLCPGQHASAERLELLHGPVRRRHLLADVLGELARHVFIQREQQFVFPGEVLVEGAQAEVRPVDEGLDGEIGATRLLDEFESSGQEP